PHLERRTGPHATAHEVRLHALVERSVEVAVGQVANVRPHLGEPSLSHVDRKPRPHFLTGSYFPESADRTSRSNFTLPAAISRSAITDGLLVTSTTGRAFLVSWCARLAARITSAKRLSACS